MLQDDWSIARLRPNSVSTGVTERQFDTVEQSPQPSQTRSFYEGALRRVREGSALAPPSLFGRAGLIINDGGDAGMLAQIALNPVQLVRGDVR